LAVSAFSFGALGIHHHLAIVGFVALKDPGAEAYRGRSPLILKN